MRSACWPEQKHTRPRTQETDNRLKHLPTLFLKFSAWLVAVLKPLGFWGAGVLALLDSSTIPVPMDLIISGYVWADHRYFYLYTIMAAVGSSIGGLLPFLLGRAGGELFLLKRVDRARYERFCSLHAAPAHSVEALRLWRGRF
jgi:membrane protein YqaA with SNARE-associated domain